MRLIQGRRGRSPTADRREVLAYPARRRMLEPGTGEPFPRTGYRDRSSHQGRPDRRDKKNDLSLIEPAAGGDWQKVGVSFFIRNAKPLLGVVLPLILRAFSDKILTNFN